MFLEEQAAEKHSYASLRLFVSPIRVRARVFVFVRSSRSRLHGHDHEDFEMPLKLFEAACNEAFYQTAEISSGLKGAPLTAAAGEW